MTHLVLRSLPDHELSWVLYWQAVQAHLSLLCPYDSEGTCTLSTPNGGRLSPLTFLLCFQFSPRSFLPLFILSYERRPSSSLHKRHSFINENVVFLSSCFILFKWFPGRGVFLPDFEGGVSASAYMSVSPVTLVSHNFYLLSIHGYRWKRCCSGVELMNVVLGQLWTLDSLMTLRVTCSV